MVSNGAAHDEKIGPVAYGWLSVATALTTLALKAVAAWITGSVSLMSDAFESIVNVVAAVLAVVALRVAQRPADDKFPHGYEKVEYFSSGFEGALIVVAAGGIVFEAIPRLVAPEPIQSIDTGLVFTAAATALNVAVAQVLFRAARKHRSIALEADAHHLMSDVWTSVGVFAAILAVRLTGWHLLDPFAALLVAANIVRIGVSLVGRSMRGLLDAGFDGEEAEKVRASLDALAAKHAIEFHALRTRQAGSRRFIAVHVLVPGTWTVQHGHDLCEEVEHELRDLAPRTTVFTHLEPIEDPRSFDDQHLDR